MILVSIKNKGNGVRFFGVKIIRIGKGEIEIMLVKASSGSSGGGGTSFDFSNAECVSASGIGGYSRTFANIPKTKNVVYGMFNSSVGGLGQLTAGHFYNLLNSPQNAVVKIDGSGNCSFLNRTASSISTVSLNGTSLTIGASDANINPSHYFGLFEMQEL